MVGIVVLAALSAALAIAHDPAPTPARWVMAVSAVLVIGALGTGLLSRGATLPRRAAHGAALTALAGFTLFATTWGDVLPEHGRHWAYTCILILEAVLCLRGHPWIAVALHASTAAVFLGTWRLTGNPMNPMVIHLISHLPFFVIALYISSFIRPTLRDILALRTAARTAARAEAAAVAAVAARNDRLDWIDRTAGPWLRRIASGEPLGDRERWDCRQLEAGIRDALRAPGLTGPELDHVVADARERGVEVVLLDDGALDSEPPETAATLRALVAVRLHLASEGRVAVRIAPPGRPEMATALFSGPTGTERLVLRLEDLRAADASDRP